MVCDEQESRQQSVLTADLKDFIRRVVVPLLVDRYLTKTKTIEHSDALPRFVGDKDFRCPPSQRIAVPQSRSTTSLSSVVQIPGLPPAEYESAMSTFLLRTGHSARKFPFLLLLGTKKIVATNRYLLNGNWLPNTRTLACIGNRRTFDNSAPQGHAV